MVEYLYERDLRQMKYIIVTSPLHEVVISELAEHYALGRQAIRKKMIEECDMSLLENIPARYEVWKTEDSVRDPVERQLGMRLLTVYIPMLPAKEMKKVEDSVRSRISEGIPEDEAYQTGIEAIREMVQR
jgi:energy-converting hydrogenase A subunit M